MNEAFLTGMGHELRTPLTVIIGQAEILRDGIFGSLNEAQQKSVLSIENSGRHLAALIRDSIDLARIEAAGLELASDTVHVEQLCASSLTAVNQEALRKRLAVSATRDPAVTWLRGDSGRIKQILVNLLVNAVTITPEGGRIGLDLAGDRERRQVRFTVWDTGGGIAANDLEKLFTPFVQGESRPPCRHESSCLGLALARQLARLHGGEVAATSEAGIGSRFTVTLPWAEEVTARGPESPDSSPAGDCGRREQT